MKKNLISLAAATLLLSACGTENLRSFQTDCFQIDINPKGYIVGMWDRTKENPNFSPTDQPSPLLALYDEEVRRYYYP